MTDYFYSMRKKYTLPPKCTTGLNDGIIPWENIKKAVSFEIAFLFYIAAITSKPFQLPTADAGCKWLLVDVPGPPPKVS